jgi:hypothetical protein
MPLPRYHHQMSGRSDKEPTRRDLSLVARLAL